MADSKTYWKAKLVRKLILESTTEAGSGHPTSSLSATDLMSVLFDSYFSFDIKNPRNPNNDRLIFSKGHASPLFYALWAVAGGISLKEIMTLRKFKSRLEGHPTMEFPYTEAATGSLGQGLSIGAGIALSYRQKAISNKPGQTPKVFVLLGDGECAEGQVWEAANFASFYKLSNLVAIVDVNRLGQSQETMFGHHVDEYVQRFSSFGWEVLAIDGHNYEEIDRAFRLATQNKSNKPFVIIAKTIKGKGVSFLENKDGWHGKALKKEELEKALEELGKVDEKLRFDLVARGPVAPSSHPTSSSRKAGLRALDGTPSGRATPHAVQIDFKKGEMVATREVYGKVLAELGEKIPEIVALDAEVKNSTFSQDFLKVFPDRFIECFIAEQNMVGVSAGFSRMGYVPFVSTFAAFLTRAFDQIRMSAQSRSNIKFVGSHAGVSIGEDGASQMALEDFAMFGSVLESIIFHPSDAVSATHILSLMLEHEGISYLRTLRPKTPVLYSSNDKFKIGGSRILRFAQDDMLTIAGCGITVHEALKAHDELKKNGISVRVVDCYSIKPVDGKTLEKCANETQKPIVIIVEDHYPHGGLGDFVLSSLSGSSVTVEKMAVSKIPRSGTPDELLSYCGISSGDIVKKVKSLL